MSTLKFPLGQVSATPSVLASLAEAEQTPSEFLLRHQSGNWGDVDDEDWNANEFALETNRHRIVSSYKTARGVEFWIITERDRTFTTLLLPSEY